MNEGRRRCTELESELDQVNQEIGEARVDRFCFFLSPCVRLLEDMLLLVRSK